MAEKIVIGLFLVLCFYPLTAQEESAGSRTEEVSEKDKKKEEKEKLKSTLQEWKESLQFGITEDALATLKAIRSAEEESLNPDLVVLFGQTMNQKLKEEILGYFTETEYPGLIGSCREILKEVNDEPRQLGILSIRYLGALKEESLKGFIPELLESGEKQIAQAAILALRNYESPELGALLLEKMEDDEFDNSLKPDIILTLGEMKYTKAVDSLIKIMEDEDEDNIWRMYATDSLGKIGDPEAVEGLKKLFGEDNALLRAYAAAALSHFDTEDTLDILIQGLKDDNWKVRLRAAEGLASGKAEKAVPILIYKVKKDPVRKVQLEGIKALGVIGSKEALTFLRGIYTSDSESMDKRAAALQALLEENEKMALEEAEKIVKAEAGKAMGKSPVVEMTARELSLIESPGLKTIYVLFLESPNMILRIYGLRGAVKNKFTSLKDQIKKMSEEDKADNVKKEALRALEKL